MALHSQLSGCAPFVRTSVGQCPDNVRPFNRNLNTYLIDIYRLMCHFSPMFNVQSFFRINIAIYSVFLQFPQKQVLNIAQRCTLSNPFRVRCIETAQIPSSPAENSAKFGYADIMECVRCGATAVVEGSLMETTGNGAVAFLSADTSLLKRIFGSGSRKITAHACVHCSHLELTVEFTEKDRKRYQEFDGPQPGVLERIN